MVLTVSDITEPYLGTGLMAAQEEEGMVVVVVAVVMQPFLTPSYPPLVFTSSSTHQTLLRTPMNVIR